jgi:DNA-directed RNA polymerase subunit RPC12/RpoP
MIDWPPGPKELRTYIIQAKPKIRVTYQGIPPCLWCGEPVNYLSMDGPLVCPYCDSGKNKDGSKWTLREYQVHLNHFKESVAEIRDNE